MKELAFDKIFKNPRFRILKYAFQGIMMCELCTLDRVVIRPEKRKKKFCRFISCGEENFVELPALERKYGPEMKALAKLMLKD